MKVALISDTHFGMKRNNETFLQSQLKFFRNQFIPYLKQNNITTIFHLGDCFDTRVSIDSKIMNIVIDLFKYDLKDFTIYLMIGNHDTYFDTTIDVNSLRPLTFLNNVHVITKVDQISIENTSITMCPWIVDSEAFYEEIKDIESDICMGHFSIAKCKMFRDQDAESGLDKDVFLNKFKLTLSGHFHTRSEEVKNNNKIIYFGNPYHMTRSDINDKRGFAILDTKSLELEYIDNTESIKFVSYNYPKKLVKSDIYNNHVDINVGYDDSYNEIEVQEYIERIEKYEPAFPINLKTINKLEVNADEDIKIDSINNLINEYLNTADINVTYKPQIQSLIINLHNECINDI